MNQYLSFFKIDFWTIWGLAAQAMFFSRFIIQWFASEKEKKVVVPKIFWYISITGAFMVLIYGIVRKDFVFFITGILQIGLYSRLIILTNKSK